MRGGCVRSATPPGPVRVRPPSACAYAKRTGPAPPRRPGGGGGGGGRTPPPPRECTHARTHAHTHAHTHTHTHTTYPPCIRLSPRRARPCLSHSHPARSRRRAPPEEQPPPPCGHTTPQGAGAFVAAEGAQGKAGAAGGIEGEGHGRTSGVGGCGAALVALGARGGGPAGRVGGALPQAHAHARERAPHASHADN